MLRLQERERPAADPGRGAAVRRSRRRRPGWCCTASGCAPSSPQRLVELSARAEELRRLARAAGRHPGRRAPAARARHPRRRPAAPGRARGQPPAGPDPRDPGAGAGRARSWPSSAAAADAAIDDPGRPVPRHLPALLGDGRRRRRAAGRASAPARSRSTVVDGAGRRGTPPTSRPRCTSAAWRPCRTPPSTPARGQVDGRRCAAAGDRLSCDVARRRLRVRPRARSRPATGLANMRDRVDAVGGAPRLVRPGPRAAPGSAAGCPSPRCPRRWWAECAPALAWLLVGLSAVVCRRGHRRRRRRTSRCCPRPPSRSTAGRSSTLAVARQRRAWARSIVVPLPAAPDRLAAQRRRGHHRGLPGRRGLQHLGARARAAPAPRGPASVGRLGRRAARRASSRSPGSPLMFLLAPDGHFLSRRWRYVAWRRRARPAAVRRRPVLSQSTRTTSTGAATRSTSAPLASAAHLGRLPADQRRAARVASSRMVRPAAPRARARSGSSCAGSRSSAAALVGSALVDPGRRPGLQRRRADLGVERAAARVVLPAAGLLAVAVLRYRLYDVEVIINRAVVLGVAHRVRRDRLRRARRRSSASRSAAQTGGFWPSLLATAVVALAFQPLRRRVVRLADRLAYGSRAAPYEALSDFSRRLGREPGARRPCCPPSPRPPGEAVSAHERARHARRRARAAPDRRLVADGAAALADDTDALVDGADLGPGRPARARSTVRLRPGRDVRPHEQRLLDRPRRPGRARLPQRPAAGRARRPGRRARPDAPRELAASRRRHHRGRRRRAAPLEAAISREVTPAPRALRGRPRPRRRRARRRPATDALVDRATAAPWSRCAS